MGAAAYIVGPMTVLMSNDYEKVDIGGIDVTFGTTEEPKTATLERVWLDDPRPRAGRTVAVKVMFRTYRGDEIVRTLPIEIPANASGSLSLLVSDGARLGQNEQREARAPQPRSVDQIIRTLNKGRRNNSLYIKLLGSEAGAIVKRRTAVGAAAVGPRRARGRPQRRQLQPAAQRDDRPVGAAHRPRGHRRPDTHDHRLPKLMPSRFRVLLTTAIVAAALVSLRASSPKFFQTATQADFLKGDVENLSIDHHGQLTLGPVTELVYETSAPFLWSMVAAPDGTLFVGTGNEGKVFRVDPRGNGSLFFDSAELEAHALALAPDGGLYVGTSPDGKIYKVDRSGSATTFFSANDKYIWALAVDAKGNLYAGTGDKGVIRKITPDGQGTTFYKSSTTHVTALAFDKNGNLLVGTGAPGKVLRIDPDGKAFVLLDSPFQEIRALRFDDKGMLYVAAISGRAGSGSAPVVTDSVGDRPADVVRAPIASVSAEITSMSIVDVERRRVPGTATRGSPIAQGRRLPHLARRTLGSGMGVARGLALRPDLRSRRRLDHRHRRQGQDVPAGR